MLGITNLWGQRTTAPIAELGQVELAVTSQALGLGATTPVPITKFILTTGQTAFKFRGKEISVGDLGRLCAKADVPLVGSWDN
jgi:hypothetical protein